MQKNCYIVVGVSGSGKSTVILNMIREMANSSIPYGHISIFSLDTCRLIFHAREFPDAVFENEADRYAAAWEYANAESSLFNSFVASWWANALTSDTLFVDNTNLSRKSRVRWTQDARAKGFIVSAIEVAAPLSVVIERQRSRTDKSVPEHTVRDMYMRQQGILVGSEVECLYVVDGCKG